MFTYEFKLAMNYRTAQKWAGKICQQLIKELFNEGSSFFVPFKAFMLKGSWNKELFSGVFSVFKKKIKKAVGKKFSSKEE